MVSSMSNSYSIPVLAFVIFFRHFDSLSQIEDAVLRPLELILVRVFHKGMTPSFSGTKLAEWCEYQPMDADSVAFGGIA